MLFSFRKNEIEPVIQFYSISGRIRGCFNKPPWPTWNCPTKMATTIIHQYSPDPGWSPGLSHQVVTAARDCRHHNTCLAAEHSTPYDVTPVRAATSWSLEVPRRGATCNNSAPKGRIKQEPRLIFIPGFYSRRKTPKHRGSKYPRCPILNQKQTTSYRFGIDTQNGIRVGSNQYENSRIRNFGAKSIRFVSRFTENIIKINAFIRHNTFIHIRHTSITFIEQKTIYL